MSSAPISPLGDRVLVEKIERSEETRSGIILPKNAEGGEGSIGMVIAVGPGRETDSGTVITPKVSVGQKVIFSWGDKVEVGGKEYHLISEGSLLGVVDDDGNGSSSQPLNMPEHSGNSPSDDGIVAGPDTGSATPDTGSATPDNDTGSFSQ